VRVVDELLNDEALVDGVLAAMRGRFAQSGRRGRYGTPAEVALRMTAVDGRLEVLRTAPRVLQLETKRLEKEIAASLNDLRQVLSERPGDARRFLEKLLDGKLTFTPVDTWKSRRYRIEGNASLGGLFRLPETLFVASPEGVETVLAHLRKCLSFLDFVPVTGTCG
jgi:hypothetical protein